ncbi:MAG: hypothetical protein QOJ05_407, partial [Verrucomicrobiota bacterium]
ITTESRPVQEFTSVEAEGAFDIEWVPGPASCTIRTDENLLSHVETDVRGSKLELRWHGQLRPTHGMKVRLSSSKLNSTRLTGAVRFAATRLDGKAFYIDGTGATRVTVDGAVDDLMATMAGASKLNAESLQVKNAELSISGAGKAEVSVSDSLKVAIAGAGKVTYRGNPRVERQISGAGSVRQRD